MKKWTGKALAGLAIVAVSHLAGAAPALISTMPGTGDSTGSVDTWASGMWNDVAAGFEVGSAGYVTNVLAALRASPAPVSSAGFIVGIAGDALIGTASGSMNQCCVGIGLTVRRCIHRQKSPKEIGTGQ